MRLLKTVTATMPIVQMRNLKPRRGENWPSGTHPCWQQNTPGLLPLSPQLRAWSQSWPYRILLIVPTVYGPGHTGCPSSQPCTSLAIFPCPLWGTLPDLLASGNPRRKPKNHSLFPSGISLSNCRGKITGQGVCATSGVQPRVTWGPEASPHQPLF